MPQSACALDRHIYIPRQPAPGQGARWPRAPRRDGRVAEGARLESVYTGNRIVGSNPTPSATIEKFLIRRDAPICSSARLFAWRDTARASFHAGADGEEVMR